MVLYYLKESVPNRPMPDELIDFNVRIDYGKLRHLLVVNRQAAVHETELNGNFDLLRHIIGEGRVDANVQSGFPFEQLHEPDNFISLLHYFGLLSIRGAAHGLVRLSIPNQTVKRLMYGFLRDAYRDAGAFSVRRHVFAALVRDMAYEGAWWPALKFLSGAIAEQTGIRDYIDGEKIVHAFLAAYFSIADHFLIYSEREGEQGLCGPLPGTFLAQYGDILFGYVIELKYVKRSAAPDESLLAAKTEEAKRQLRRYLQDERLARAFPSVTFIGLAIVFHGWELVVCEAVKA